MKQAVDWLVPAFSLAPAQSTYVCTSDPLPRVAPPTVAGHSPINHQPRKCLTGLPPDKPEGGKFSIAPPSSPVTLGCHVELPRTWNSSHNQQAEAQRTGPGL